MKIEAIAHSECGPVRKGNEDSYLVDTHNQLYIVADGMGGHAAGDVASRMAVDYIKDMVQRHRMVIEAFDRAEADAEAVETMLEDAVRKAGSTIFQSAAQHSNYRGMGTTVSALLLTKRRGFVAHVGDSRIYLARDDAVEQITEDHSLLNEMIKQGRITPGDPRCAAYSNAITRAVGIYHDVKVDAFNFEIAAGDTYLLCSDGLSEFLTTPREIYEVVEAKGLEDTPSHLVELAINRGSRDNATGVIVHIHHNQGATHLPEAKILSNRLNLLQRMPLFQHLTYVELMTILKLAEIRAVSAGDQVFSDRDVGEELFIILGGTVRISKSDLTLAQLDVGGHFGEMAILDKGLRSATATASTDSQLLVVGRRALFALMKKDKDVAVKLLWSLVYVVNERLRLANVELSETHDASASQTVIPPIGNAG